MTAISDEDLMRFADGELTRAAADAITARLPQDAELRRRLDVFLVTRLPVAAVFDEVLAEPVPEHLIAAIRRAAPAPRATPKQVSPFDRLRALLQDTAAALSPASFSPAFAAGLVAAVLSAGTVGWLAGRTSAPAPIIAASETGLIAAGALAHALEATPSETPYSAGQATIVPVMSFAAEADGVCREYRIERADAGPDFAGVACRTPEGTWRIPLHVGTTKYLSANPDKPHQTASGHAVAEIDALTATLMSGVAFGDEDEAKRMQNGWRVPGQP
jgi:anti-sigma factor RsiW